MSGAHVAALYAGVFAVYFCYGAQASVNPAMVSDFWGTRHAGVNYGIFFSAWGAAGIIGPTIGGVLFDKYGNYEEAFYVAGILAAVALVCEMLARRPHVPVTMSFAGRKIPPLHTPREWGTRTILAFELIAS